MERSTWSGRCGRSVLDLLRRICRRGCRRPTRHDRSNGRRGVTVPRSVALKIQRAGDHVDRLESVEEAFLDTNPYEARRVIDDPDRSGKGSTHRIVWKRYVEAPDTMGLYIG